jgi:hypothetical protein
MISRMPAPRDSSTELSNELGRNRHDREYRLSPTTYADVRSKRAAAGGLRRFRPVSAIDAVVPIGLPAGLCVIVRSPRTDLNHRGMADAEDLKSSGGNARVGSNPTAANHSSRPAVGVQKSNARGVSQRRTR